jgi:hypothetical protein
VFGLGEAAALAAEVSRSAASMRAATSEIEHLRSEVSRYATANMRLVDQITQQRETYDQLTKTHQALLGMHQDLLAQFASMKREGFVAEPPSRSMPEQEPLPTAVQDAIEQRSFDVPTRQTLIQFAREHLATEDPDDVAEAILNGGPIPAL